jgi:hypothetical protein
MTITRAAYLLAITCLGLRGQTMQTFKTGVWAGLTGISQNLPAFTATTFQIDAAGEKAAFVFQVPKTGTLDKVEFRIGAVTIDGSSVLRVSFQDLNDTDGNPDGTQDQYRDIAAGSVSANSWITPGLMTSDGTDTGTKRNVTAGQFMAFVVEYQTFAGTNAVQITGFMRSTFGGMPHGLLYTTSWSEISSNASPVMALRYDDGSYEAPLGTFPISNFTEVAFNSNSTPDERGLYFQVPFPTRLKGGFFAVDLAGAGRAFDILLYQQGNDTPLATLSVDGDLLFGWGADRGSLFLFPNPVPLSKDTYYRLVVRPTATGFNAGLQEFDVASAVIMNAMEGGQNWHYTARTDGATTGGTLNDGWTQTTTKRPFISPLFDQFHDGIGGSSGGGGACSSTFVQ